MSTATTTVSAAPPVRNPSAGAVARLVRGTAIFRVGKSFQALPVYSRFAYLVVAREDARKAATLPGTSLVYMSGTDVATGFNTGVSRNRAAANGWLLRDSAGAVVVREGLPDVFLADVGDPAYQQLWLKNVLAFLQASKVDGVFIDDVIGDVQPWSAGHTYPAKYPAQPEWESVMLSFVRAVGPALKARGYYVLLNASKFIEGDKASDNGSTAADWWRRLAPWASGLLSESWVQSTVKDADRTPRLRAEGSEWYEQWAGWQQLVNVAQGAGADFFGLTYGARGDERAMRYGRASFLIDWHGKGGAFVFEYTDGSDPRHQAWSVDLGKPLRPKLQLAPGVWRRGFERGIVVVNSTNAPVTALIGGLTRTIDPADAVIHPR